jgi:glucose-fructose oxidoreductase
MLEAIENFAIPAERVFLDIEDCVQETTPDLAILCPATARHAEVVEQVAPLGTDILLEKPFAPSLADADRILAAVRKAGVRLAVNWPLRWYPPHVTTRRLLDEGLIGEPIEVHFYDGNRGPLYHRADKVVVSDEAREASLVVVHASRWRRQPPRLPRLWRDSRHLVHERRSACRGHVGRRPIRRARG